MISVSSPGRVSGHESQWSLFARAEARNRLASTFLFVGPAGIGKRTFAQQLGKTLLCPERGADFQACGVCPSCLQCDAGTHPDLLYICKPEDRTEFPVRLLFGEKETRMREGLCSDITKKPFMGGRRVAILDDADTLNEEGANCLLKTLEEPPPHSVMILIGTSASLQLPTIRSRCQVVRFSSLPTAVVEQILRESPEVAERCKKRGVTIPTNEAELRQLAEHGDGSVLRAIELADPELWKFRDHLYGMLSEHPFRSVRTAAMIMEFVENGTKEASVKRMRIRFVLDSAITFLRYQIRENMTEYRLRQLDRTILASEQLARNLHMTTLVEAWCDALVVSAVHRS
ncbi:MAG: AAA family ATPase [Planctomycetia bacterium]|nr:AAA family ATPase [Planctomycetia bacterium]